MIHTRSRAELSTPKNSSWIASQLASDRSDHLHLIRPLAWMRREQLLQRQRLAGHERPVVQEDCLQRIYCISFHLQMRIAPKAKLAIKPK